ncbi:MAG: putative bifunctional diguanylate cyclase/phosphodiesterase, partial [Actinomycetota bacterium]
FRDRVDRAILAARREETPVAIMLMDLDRFKEINDTLGHHTGDSLLLNVGERLRSTLRESDTIARLGGDEFAILLPKVSNRAAAERAASKILEALSMPFQVDDMALDMGGSIGVAIFPEHGGDADELIQRADVAMYAAKELRSGYEVYAQERDKYSSDRLSLIGDLRRAIDDGELVLHYQPKASLETGEIPGVEALVRWQHPSRGLIPPTEFIGLAEHTGLIRPLTLCVIDQALRQVSKWQRNGLPIGVAVNLSAQNLLDVHLPEEISRLLSKWGVSPARLELEITESSIMIDPQRAREVLGRLDGSGMQLAIDDFGTGYSSLAYLRQLPVSSIKIDRSFVLGMSDNENDAVIVRSTVELGRNLGLKVVAEGVETEELWNRLAGLKCDLAQGYFLNRPMPGEDLTRWLLERLQSRISQPATQLA